MNFILVSCCREVSAEEGHKSPSILQDHKAAVRDPDWSYWRPAGGSSPGRRCCWLGVGQWGARRLLGLQMGFEGEPRFADELDGSEREESRIAVLTSSWVNGCFLCHLLRRGHCGRRGCCYLFDLLSFVSGGEKEDFCLDMLSLKCILAMQVGMFNGQLGIEVWCLGREQGADLRLGAACIQMVLRARGMDRLIQGARRWKRGPQTAWLLLRLEVRSTSRRQRCVEEKADGQVQLSACR